MTNFKYDVREYMKLYPDFLTEKDCKKTINLLKKEVWDKHNYYDANNETGVQYENDLSVCCPGSELFAIQNKRLWDYLYDYLFNHIKQDTFSCWHGYTQIRYNRYSKGEEMRNHIDHINSIFDGTVKGVPTLTILGSLNDNYQGGELIFFNDVEIKMPPGSIVIFPSTFMYPHMVKPVKKGTRYSFVSWVW